MKLCVVFVCNRAYLSKFINTLNSLRTIGDYKGEVCLIIGDDLKPLTSEIIRDHKVTIKYFPNLPILTNKEFLNKQKQLRRPNHWFNKRFQYHKFYLFDIYFKQWDYVLYLDCGINIYDKIKPILDFSKPDKLIGNRDGVDNESPTWCVPISPGNGLKLGDQFVKDDLLYEKLKNSYDISKSYFQTTIMLYDTNIIKDDTFTNIYNLLLEYPISITNDQGIIALYFTQLYPCWEQIMRKVNNTLYTYDYVRCVNENYIMVKNNSNNWLHIGYNS